MPTMDVFHSQLDEPGEEDNDVEINSHDIQPKPVEKHEIHITERNPETVLPTKHDNPPVEFTNATFITGSYQQGRQGQHLVNAQHTWKRRILIRATTANVYVSPLPPIDTVSDPDPNNPPGTIVKVADTQPLEMWYTGDLYFYFLATAVVSIYIEYCENAGFI